MNKFDSNSVIVVVACLTLSLIIFWDLFFPPKHPRRYAQATSPGYPCAYRGSFAVGVPILCRVGDYIYEGASQSGTPIFSVNGRSIYRGASGSGFPVATLSSGEDYVMEGAFGKFVGHIAGGSVWRLGSDNKTIVASSEDRMLLVAALFI